MKYCKRCGVVKELSEFGSHSGQIDGRQPWCSDCRKTYNRAKYEPKNNPKEPRKGTCAACGKEFLLLSKKRKYCSNNCKSSWHHRSKTRLDWYEKNPEKCMLYRNRFASKVKGIPFSLEEPDIIIPEFCPILGLKLEKGKDNSCDNSPSLDKIVPELGYIKGNVRVISQRANLLKSNATIEELRLVYEDLLRLQKPDTTILSETDYPSSAGEDF
jgi:hypothetical protein